MHISHRSKRSIPNQVFQAEQEQFFHFGVELFHFAELLNAS